MPSTKRQHIIAMELNDDNDEYTTAARGMQG